MPAAADARIEWGAAVVGAMTRGREAFHCSVFLYEPSVDALRLVGQRWGSGRDLGLVRVGEWVVPLTGSVCGWVYRSGLPAIVADVRSDAEFRSYPGADTRSELAVPIVVGASGERVVGVLNVESPRVGTFGIADVEDLQAIARDAASALVSRGLC